ncbi:hypothetical protein ACFPJ1_25195, partial [Kribbella qitaiheensis]|uniref:hypothetical protein n=1 Tax=Kribbella qitaiheensis TaxID=1544730 RepID=UPI00361BD702
EQPQHPPGNPRGAEAPLLHRIKDEASGHNLALGDLMPLLVPKAPFPSRTPADLAAVSSDAWRSYWVDVCTNETMPQLVDVLFPDSLVKKLEWMEIEGSKFAYVLNTVTSTKDPAQKLAVFGSAPARSLAVSVCNDKEMIQLVLELGGGWNEWKPWVLAEGAPLRDLGLAAVAKGSIAGELDKRFLTWVTADEADTAYRRLGSFGDIDLAMLRTGPMPADVIRDRYGGQAEKVLRALNGELARETKKVNTEEKLLTGPTSGPFKEKSFGGDKRFTLSYWRDRVEVEVGVSMSAVDDRAKAQLASAKATWSSKIASAWNGFELTNANRTIPMQMKISFEGGPNSVKVHSGPWVWPDYNAGNWYIPDPERVPGQADANAQAPVHEFGHLIGNLDEYDASAEHFVHVTGVDPSKPGRPASITEETDTEGTKRYTDTGSVMGTGGSGPALARHVDDIVTWVNQNLQAGEPALTLRARGPGGGP